MVTDDRSASRLAAARPEPGSSRRDATRPARRRQGAGGDARGRRRDARVLRSGQRLVPDRRACPGGRPRARVGVAIGRRARRRRRVHRSCSPRSPKARRPAPTLRDWCAVETERGARDLVARAARGRHRPRRRVVPALDGARANGSCATRAAVLGPAKLTQDRRRARSASRLRPVDQRAGDAYASGRSRNRASPRPPSRARSSRAVAELGATANTVDPVFQVMPRSVAGRGRLPDRRRSRASSQRGDVIWVDTGINLARLRLRLRRDVVRRRATRRDRAATSSPRWRDVVDRALAAIRARRDRRATSCAPPGYRQRPHAPGSRTSTSRTASAPTARRCRSSAPTSARVRRGARAAAGHGARVRTGDLGRRSRGPSLRGDRRGHRHGLPPPLRAGRRSTRRAHDPPRRLHRRRCGRTTSTCSSSGGDCHVTRVHRRERSSGWRAPASSRRPPSSCARPRSVARAADDVEPGAPRRGAARGTRPVERRARVGVDGMNPGARDVARARSRRTRPSSTRRPMLRALLRVKTPEEIVALRDAAAVAVDALAAMRNMSRSGRDRGRTPGRVRRTGRGRRA